MDHNFHISLPPPLSLTRTHTHTHTHTIIELSISCSHLHNTLFQHLPSKQVLTVNKIVLSIGKERFRLFSSIGYCIYHISFKNVTLSPSEKVNFGDHYISFKVPLKEMKIG